MCADRSRPAYNRRAEDLDAVPAPMPVRDEVIEACRQHVEGRAKARLRRLLLPAIRWRLRAQEIGEGFHWALPLSARGARIGRFASIGAGSNLSGPVSIGDLTMISSQVRLFGDDHVLDDPETPMRYAFPRVPRATTVIEADCWIGMGVLIREGVTIRRGTVVGSGAVVTRDTEPYTVVAGVPARVLRQRFGPDDRRRYDRMLYGTEASR